MYQTDFIGDSIFVYDNVKVIWNSIIKYNTIVSYIYNILFNRVQNEEIKLLYYYPYYDYY